jgi:Glycosyltransferases, probably involved in cell wall biogenesis
MSVSVLVPSYNHAPFIERTLRSIFAQTLKPKKLVVIDDGSKDESARIIEKILRECPFESDFIARENRGLSATLNEGFALCKDTEFFAYLGSDDVWLPEFLEERVKFLRSRPEAALAFGHAFLIDENENIIDSTAEWFDFEEKKILHHLLNGEIFSSPTVVYRSEFLKKHRWNEESILEDYELYLKLAAEGEFAFDPRVLSAWRQHGWNVSGDFPKMLAEWLAAQNRVAERLPFSRAELDEIQTHLRFKSVADFVRYGYRREALRLFRENLRGARSSAQIGKMLVRLLAPPPLFQWNRRRKRENKIRRYGNLKKFLENEKSLKF